MSAVRFPAGYLCFAALAGAVLLNALGLVSSQSVDRVFLLPAAWAAFRLVRRPGQGVAVPLFAAIGVAAVLAALQVWLPDLRYMPYLAIVPANLFLAWLFARGLLPGRRPVLLHLVDMMGQRSADDPRFRRFVAWQCVIWSLLTLATAIVAAVAVVWAARRIELAIALGWLFGAQMVWFPVSHLYAGFRHGRPETFLDTLRVMLQPGLWARLRT